MTPEIERSIVKYITKSATAAELDMLSAWIKKPAHKQVFKNYVQIHYAITYSMNDPDPNEVIEQTLRIIKKEKSWKYRFRTKVVYRYAAAALVAVILVSGYFFKDQIFDGQGHPPAVVNSIVKGTDKATLTTENGDEVSLEKGTIYQTKNIRSNGTQIVYHPVDTAAAPEIVYNYLTVPRGGQFTLQLSDGTKVWLNSESRLKYPVRFKERKSREVELIYGEAYFEVSPSTAHQGADFKVHHNQQEIRVLGTAFNIRAYSDETQIYTTLIEGKVSVVYQDKKQDLMPDQQAKYNLLTNTLSVTTVDVFNEISWKEGLFSFEGKTLKEIMKVLSRWYDIEVEFQNKAAEMEEFVGVLGKDLTIEDILSRIKSFGIINAYEINSKKVILK